MGEQPLGGIAVRIRPTSKEGYMKRIEFLIALVVLTFCSLFTFFGCETTDNADLNNNVLNNKMLRDNDYYDPGIITSVTFLDTLANAPKDAWDFSEAQNGCVLAWLVGTHLYVAGEGGVKAGADASYMFAEWGKTEGTASFSSGSYNVLTPIYYPDNLEEIDFGSNCFDTSGVTNMQGMFRRCVVKQLNLSDFDTSNVTDMSSMFADCRMIKRLDLRSFDTANVRDMAGMFNSCYKVQYILFGSYDPFGDDFDTSNVVRMSGMFNYCRMLTELDLVAFDTANVVDMGSMFAGCDRLMHVDLSLFDTSKVADMSFMFEGCSSLPYLYLGNFDTLNVINMNGMFRDCGSLQTLNLQAFDTSNVTGMSEMFFGCAALTKLDLQNFKISDETRMENMFRDTKWENNPSAVLP